MFTAGTNGKVQNSAFVGDAYIFFSADHCFSYKHLSSIAQKYRYLPHSTLRQQATSGMSFRGTVHNPLPSRLPVKKKNTTVIQQVGPKSHEFCTEALVTARVFGHPINYLTQQDNVVFCRILLIPSNIAPPASPSARPPEILDTC